MTWFLALVLTPSAAAVDVCKWAEYGTDKFKGTQTVTMESRGHALRVTSEGATLDLTFIEPGVKDTRLPAGFQMQWLLEDGTKITFVSEAASGPMPRAWASQYAAGIITAWKVAFHVSAEAAHAIAQSGPTTVRYEITEERTLELSRSDGRIYQRDFACASNNLFE
jgi:hypothetical protein